MPTCTQVVAPYEPAKRHDQHRRNETDPERTVEPEAAMVDAEQRADDAGVNVEGEDDAHGGALG